MVQHAHTIFGVLGLAFTEFTPVYLDFEAGADGSRAARSTPSSSARSRTR